jgi:hypothetical protein
MFNLDQEVRAWTEAAYAKRCGRQGSIAELTDHLYCEIDRARATGLSDTQAFAAAVAKMGPPAEFAAEEQKNDSLFQRTCAALLRWERAVPGPHRQRLMVAHGLIWAAVMLALALIWKRTGGAPTTGWFFVTIVISCWWTSESILRRAVSKPRKGA